MISSEKFRKIMLYIIEGKGHTLTDTANHFKMTRQEIKNLVNRINDKYDDYYDEVLCEEVNDKLFAALKKARSGAGTKSKKKQALTEDEALALRFKNVYGGVSLRKLGEEKGVSFMTVSNAIKNLPEDLKKSQDEMAKKMLK